MRRANGWRREGKKGRELGKYDRGHFSQGSFVDWRCVRRCGSGIMWTGTMGKVSECRIWYGVR